MIGIIKILVDDASVGARAANRIYPIQRPQKSALPAISVKIDDNDPSDTKDGVSGLDQLQVSVISYASTYDDARLLAIDVRTALDRITGTYNGEVIQSIQFLDEYVDVEEIANNIVYFIEQNYKVRIEK